MTEASHRRNCGQIGTGERNMGLPASALGLAAGALESSGTGKSRLQTTHLGVEDASKTTPNHRQDQPGALPPPKSHRMNI